MGKTGELARQTALSSSTSPPLEQTTPSRFLVAFFSFLAPLTLIWKRDPRSFHLQGLDLSSFFLNSNLLKLKQVTKNVWRPPMTNDHLYTGLS